MICSADNVSWQQRTPPPFGSALCSRTFWNRRRLSTLQYMYFLKAPDDRWLDHDLSLVAELVVFAPPLLSVHIIAHANGNGSLWPHNPEFVLNREAAQPTCYNSGRTIPQFLTQPIGTTDKILIVIKLDPGLLIPAGQLLQWVLSNWNTHENKKI